MKRFVLTPRAKQDLNEIWDYIASDNIEAADRILDALDNAMINLAKSPGIGHWREELTRQAAPLLSGLFVLDRPSARKKAAADYPGPPRRPRCAEPPWHGVR
jgi:plasmid stabilization system protein ParE